MQEELAGTTRQYDHMNPERHLEVDAQPDKTMIVRF
jgi:hypothetical protein